jgi:hypothetical protein
MGFYRGPNIVTDNLTFAIDAGSTRSYPGSGTTVTSLVGSATGTLNNGVGFSAANGGNFTFDGVDDHINLGVGTGLNQYSGDFAISVWVMRVTGGGNYGSIIADYYTNSTATTNEWQIMVGPSSQFVLYKVPGYVINATSSGFSNGTWINLVVTRIGSTISMYANSNLIATATNSTTFGTSTGNFNIGIDGNNSSEPLTGKISALQIRNSQGLTAAEVLQNFNAQKSRFGL